MLRTLGASAALAVIVPLPVVAATTAAADGPNIPSAALTLTATVGLGHESLTYLVLASGPPPPASTTLVDAAGESPVQVKASMTAGTACVAGPAHLTGLGNDPWCLHLIGVDAGHSVSGQLKGTRSVVTLTVKARQAIWLPALTGALILLLAVLAAWLAGTFLPPRVSRVLLHLEVCKDGGVTGLKEWADKADGRISTADVLARVRWAK